MIHREFISAVGTKLTIVLRYLLSKVNKSLYELVFLLFKGLGLPCISVHIHLQLLVYVSAIESLYQSLGNYKNMPTLSCFNCK